MDPGGWRRQFALDIGIVVDTYVGVGRSEDPQFSVCHRLCSSYYVQQNDSLIFERGASATDTLRVYKEAYVIRVGGGGKLENIQSNKVPPQETIAPNHYQYQLVEKTIIGKNLIVNIVVAGTANHVVTAFDVPSLVSLSRLCTLFTYLISSSVLGHWPGAATGVVLIVFVHGCCPPFPLNWYQGFRFGEIHQRRSPRNWQLAVPRGSSLAPSALSLLRRPQGAARE